MEETVKGLFWGEKKKGKQHLFMPTSMCRELFMFTSFNPPKKAMRSFYYPILKTSEMRH